uniref:Uncharacterized protein n=1 Tax=Populus trichocarpa TaxID=3694 RepID=B9HMR4_POPTR
MHQRTLASHAVTAGTCSNRNMVTSPTQSSASPAPSQGGQSGSTSSTGSTQMQAWVQGAISKISSTTDGVNSSTPNLISGPSSIVPISINTGTPAIRLIAKPVGDGPASRNRVGSGNAGQGYSFEEPTTRGEAHEEQKQRRR